MTRNSVPRLNRQGGVLEERGGARRTITLPARSVPIAKAILGGSKRKRGKKMLTVQELPSVDDYEKIAVAGLLKRFGLLDISIVDP